AKMYNSEAAWRVIDDTVQIRGGRGYETAASLAARGEAPLRAGRAMREPRLNTSFEGPSETMRLRVAREAADPRIQRAGAFVEPEAPAGAKLRGALNLGVHFAGWYPRLWLGWGRWPRYAEFGPLARHLCYADRAARRLGRMLFYAMA